MHSAEYLRASSGQQQFVILHLKSILEDCSLVLDIYSHNLQQILKIITGEPLKRPQSRLD